MCRFGDPGVAAVQVRFGSCMQSHTTPNLHFSECVFDNDECTSLGFCLPLYVFHVLPFLLF